MSIKQKIAIYLGLLVMLALILLLWAVFAYKGKTDVGAFIMQLGGLITIIVAAISAVGGFHSGQSRQGGATLLAPGSSLSDFAEPLIPITPATPAASVIPQAATDPAQPAAPQ